MQSSITIAMMMSIIMMTISRVGRARANSGVGEQAREQARGGKQPPLPPLPHSLPGKS